MKVKNIVFSGFAAAILMGTAGANAATPFRIASQAYVDREVASVQSAVNALTTGDNSVDSKIENVVGDTTGLTGFDDDTNTVVEALNELKGDANDAATAAATAQTAAEAAQSDVDALETVVAGKADAAALGAGIGTGAGERTVADALAEKVNVTDKATTIGSTADASDDKWATQKAVADAIANVTGGGATIGVLSDGNGGTYASVAAALADKADASDVDALETVVGDSTSGLVADVTALETAVGDSTSGLVADVTALETAVGDANSGLTKGVADNAAAITTINTALEGKQDALSADDLAAIATLVNGYTSCVNDPNNVSEHCVLSVAKNGTPTWTAVTDPWQVEP